jgi:hypothetical protein
LDRAASYFVPVIAYFVWKSFAVHLALLPFIGCFMGGLLVWTFTEYVLHRFFFIEPRSEWGKTPFYFHGVHHDYPQDALPRYASS